MLRNRTGGRATAGPARRAPMTSNQPDQGSTGPGRVQRQCQHSRNWPGCRRNDNSSRLSAIPTLRVQCQQRRRRKVALGGSQMARTTRTAGRGCQRIWRRCHFPGRSPVPGFHDAAEISWPHRRQPRCPPAGKCPVEPAETIGQAWICRIQPALGQDRVGNDNGPRPERRIQPSGQTKADQGIRTPLDQSARRIRRTG